MSCWRPWVKILEAPLSVPSLEMGPARQLRLSLLSLLPFLHVVAENVDLWDSRTFLPRVLCLYLLFIHPLPSVFHYLLST